MVIVWRPSSTPRTARGSRPPATASRCRAPRVRRPHATPPPGCATKGRGPHPWRRSEDRSLHLREEVGSDEGAPAGRQENVTDGVVLALVELPRLHPVHDRAALVHRHPDVQQAPRILPAHELRGHHAGVRAEGLLDQDAHGLRVRSHVVVTEQEVRGPLDHPEDGVRAGAEALVVLQAPDVCVWKNCGDPLGNVDHAVVQDEHREPGVVLGPRRRRAPPRSMAPGRK